MSPIKIGLVILEGPCSLRMRMISSRGEINQSNCKRNPPISR